MRLVLLPTQAAAFHNHYNLYHGRVVATLVLCCVATRTAPNTWIFRVAQRFAHLLKACDTTQKAPGEAWTFLAHPQKYRQLLVHASCHRNTSLVCTILIQDTAIPYRVLIVAKTYNTTTCKIDTGGGFRAPMRRSFHAIER